MGNIVVKCEDDKGGKAPIETKTQWDGAFEFKDVPGSKHTLTVELKGYVRQSKYVEVSPTEHKTNVDFEMVEAKGSGSISGHVYDSTTKELVQGGHVSLVLPNGNKYAEVKDGFYEFTGLPADSYEIWVVSPQTRYYVNQQAKVIVIDGESKTQDFYMSEKKWTSGKHAY